VDRTRRLPPALVERARAFLAGDGRPVVPKGAATVLLLRQGSGSGDRLQVYLLRRHLEMAFAAGMYAFPGGTVDTRDSDRAVAWAGPSPAEWAERLDCDETEARALVCAAVRETFEESGVLLAGTTDESLVEDTTGDDWERDRAALVDRRLAFADFLAARELVLRTELLATWAHWITPEFEPRRYDTRFFVAALPEGQVTRDVSGEADTVAWMTAADAVTGVDSGAMLMLPPTYVTLRELSAFSSVDDVMSAAVARRIVTVLPGVEVIGDDALLTLPPEVQG
jgi:8-oxo-dGTP pyrophosphatase MutT (NUDIX family)